MIEHAGYFAFAMLVFLILFGVPTAWLKHRWLRKIGPLLLVLSVITFIVSVFHPGYKFLEASFEEVTGFELPDSSRFIGRTNFSVKHSPGLIDLSGSEVFLFEVAGYDYAWLEHVLALTGVKNSDGRELNSRVWVYGRNGKAIWGLLNDGKTVFYILSDRGEDFGVT